MGKKKSPDLGASQTADGAFEVLNPAGDVIARFDDKKLAEKSAEQKDGRTVRGGEKE